MPGRYSRRPSLTALLLAAALVFAMLAPLLGPQAWLALGMGRGRTGGGAGSELVVPAPPVTCRDQARVSWGGYRFGALCAGQAPSFDRRFWVVKNAGVLTGVGIVRGGTGESLDDLDMLDGRPFTLFWSPRSWRFFANRAEETGLDRFRLFELRGTAVVELPALPDAAMAVLRARRPCMTDADIGVSGVRWSRDGRRIMLLVYSRRQACAGTGGWGPLYMVGDVFTGRLDAASIRVRHARDKVPEDGPYAAF